MPLQARETHTGRFLLGLLCIIILLAVIVAEFYWLVSAHNLLGRDEVLRSQVAHEPQSQSFEDSIHGIAFDYPKGWAASSVSASGADPDFVATATDRETVDPVPATISLWYVKVKLRLDEYANVLREQLLQSAEVIQEDGPSANGIYVFSAYKRVTEEGTAPWTMMHAKYLIPEKVIGGVSDGYILMDVVDNVDSWNDTLKDLTKVVFPTLRKL